MVGSQGNISPIYIIESVNIMETFNPLIGVNFRTKNRLTGTIQFKKLRNITLNLTNAQITEVLSKDLTIGFGIIKTGFQPFKKLAPLKNEMNAKIDITFSDRKTVQRKFDESATITSGNLNIQIRPNITYAINNRVNINIYFERLVNAPKISSSYKSASTRFGILVRFTLS
jgi:cell surface protein SprA